MPIRDSAPGAATKPLGDGKQMFWPSVAQFPQLCNEAVSLIWKGIVYHVLGVGAPGSGHLLAWNSGPQQCFLPQHSEEKERAK